MSADSSSNLTLDSLISQLESGFFDGLESFGDVTGIQYLALLFFPFLVFHFL